MGVDARLYISMDYRLEEIADVLEAIGCVNLKAQHPIAGVWGLGYVALNFTAPNKAWTPTLNIHSHTPTPLGRATLLTLRSDPSSISLLTQVAVIMGGLLQPEDCNEMYQWYNGQLTPENGLLYHLRRAALHDGVRLTDSTAASMPALQRSIDAWNEPFRG